MHVMRLLCLALMALSTSALAEYKRHTWEGNLPERFFDTFLELYKKDPSALARYPGGLQNISSEQQAGALSGRPAEHFLRAAASRHRRPRHHPLHLHVPDDPARLRVSALQGHADRAPVSDGSAR